MKYRLREIPEGEAGTDATVRVMSRFVQEALTAGKLRLCALSIIERAGVRGGDDVGLARALFGWVRSCIRFIRDPVGVETVQSPGVTLRLLAGDCDDHATLLVALALSVGLPARWRVLGSASDAFQHIYSEIFAGGRWYPADTTVAAPFGFKPRHSGVEKLFNYEGEGVMLGVSVIGPGTAESGFRRAQYVSPGSRGSGPTGRGRGGGYGRWWGVPGGRSGMFNPRKNRLRGLGAPAPYTQVNKNAAAKAVEASVRGTLMSNWRAGKINRNDLLSYKRVIKEGNAPFSGSRFYESTVTTAIDDFQKYVDRNSLVPLKPEGQISGVGELSGLFGSIWRGIKRSVGAVVKKAASVVTGGASDEIFFTGGDEYPGEYAGPRLPARKREALIKIAPNINIPRGAIQTTVPPEAARSAVQELLNSPVTWVLGGVVVLGVGYMVLKK